MYTAKGQLDRNALIKQYAKLFELEHMKLTFTDEALKAIAIKAVARKTGARGLRSILEGLLLETMFEIPESDLKGEIVVGKEVVDGTCKPAVIPEPKASKTASK